MDTAATTFSDFPINAAPRWQEPIVLVSLSAIAAAAGFGVLYEAGAAPWLSTASALATAAVLWGVHRAARPQPAVTSSNAIGIGRRPAQLRETLAASRTQPDSRPVAPPPAAPAETPPPPSAQTMAVQVRPAPPTPELAQFSPRPTPTMLAMPAMSMPSAPIAQATTRPAQPDIKFEQLEALIREMAASVPGPKAASPDPDLAARPLVDAWALQSPPSAPASLQFGFGAQTMAQAGHRVAEAVAAERIDVLLTPIQSLIEHRASHFEVSVRFRDEDGTVLADDEVACAARNTGLAGALDALKLSRVARVARRVQARAGAPADVLADVFGPSLADGAFIAATGATLAGQPAGQPPAPIVLALAQSDVRAFGRVHWSALATLGDFGLRFAISDVTDLDMDFELMAARGFVFAKLDAGVFLDGLPLGTVVIPATDVARHLSGCGLTVIVGRIDDEQRLNEIAACGVSLGQGALFGDAKPVRQDILAA